jgi:hypothetical protein
MTAVFLGCRLQVYALSPPTDSGERTRRCVPVSAPSPKLPARYRDNKPAAPEKFAMARAPLPAREGACAPHSSPIAFIDNFRVSRRSDGASEHLVVAGS